MPKKINRGGGLIPAAARAGRHSLAKAAPSQLVLDSVTLCETALGGRRKLIEALSAAPALTPELQRIFALVSDPANDHEPLATLCRDAQVSPGDLFAAFGAAIKFLKEIIAMTTAVRATPSTVEDIAAQCVTRQVICETCDGTTTIVPSPTKKQPNPSPIPCPACRGKGQVTRPSSIDHQKLLLEYTGALKKGGITMNQQVNNLTPRSSPGGFSGGSLEQLQQAVTETLYGRHAIRVDLPDEPLDATILPSPSPADAEPST